MWMCSQEGERSSHLLIRNNISFKNPDNVNEELKFNPNLGKRRCLSCEQRPCPAGEEPHPLQTTFWGFLLLLSKWRQVRRRWWGQQGKQMLI